MQTVKAIILLGALVGFAGAAVPAPGVTLTITVTGIKAEPSTLMVGLYSEADWRQPDPKIRQAAQVNGGQASFTFDNLPPGRIGVKVLQDLNGNGKMDKTLIGAPDEPFGISNNVEPGMSFPSFDEAAVTLQPGANAISITMQEW